MTSKYSLHFPQPSSYLPFLPSLPSLAGGTGREKRQIGGGLRTYCIKEMGWPERGIEKIYFEGRTWPKRSRPNFKRGAGVCDLGQNHEFCFFDEPFQNTYGEFIFFRAIISYNSRDLTYLVLSSYHSPLYSWKEICDLGKRPSGKCPFGKMSSIKCPSGKCPFEKLSIQGTVLRGTVRRGNVHRGTVLEPINLFIFLI